MVETDKTLLTSAEAAKLLGVGISTIKRWADQGVLGCAKTQGRHRRFERERIEKLLNKSDPCAQAVNRAPCLQSAMWVEQLLSQETDAPRLSESLYKEYQARGSWHQVANFLAHVSGSIGKAWQSGDISISQEHLASEKLIRTIQICLASTPLPQNAPKAWLSVAAGEEHTLGLYFSELVLREHGIMGNFLGRNMPTHELAEHLLRSSSEMMIVTASPVAAPRILEEQAKILCTAARQSTTTLIFGGLGAWPEHIPCAQRIQCFEAFDQFLSTWTPKKPSGGAPNNH